MQAEENVLHNFYKLACYCKSIRFDKEERIYETLGKFEKGLSELSEPDGKIESAVIW